MIISSLYANNPLRNYSYLVACPHTGEVLAVDPFDASQCLTHIREQGWQLRYILNTHEHWDHVRGNAEIVAATGARVLVHHQSVAEIPFADQGVGEADIVQVGRTVKLRCLETPGHTFRHLSLYAAQEKEAPVLFSGDTLFNAGVGNCHGGDPNMLFRTLSGKLRALPDTTRLYPGHDYSEKNLRFTLSQEPGNAEAARWLAQLGERRRHPTTLGEEKQVNVFLRLDQPEVIQSVRRVFPDLPSRVDEQAIFLALRRLRDRW